MISYLTYRMLQEATTRVNTHSTHFEEKFLTSGRPGLTATIKGLRYIVNMIGKGDVPEVSTKIDGIALFFGWTQKGFMVANKGLFNKEPKMAFNADDVKANWHAGLHPMMLAALEYLPKVCPKDGSIYQGDFLFTPKTLKSVDVEGVPSWAWHPNIIEYTVSKSSPIGKKVGAAKFGIVVHTRYTWDGVDPKTLGVAEYGVSKKKFAPSSEVFLIDTISNLSAENGQVGFSAGEWSTAMELAREASNMANKLDWKLIGDENFVALLLPFVNGFVKQGKIPSIRDRASLFNSYVENKMNNELLKRKTDKGRQTIMAKYQPYLDVPQMTLANIFATMDILTAAKNMILDQLNKYALYKNFVVTKSGDYISTKDEGFVIVNTAASGLKLVDRLEFSRNNFSKDIVSGFDK